MKDNFVFDPIKHSYTLDGELLPGVTTVLNTLSKPALIGWAAKMVTEYIRDNCAWTQDGLKGREYTVSESELEKAKTAHAKKRDKAADQGTDIHSLCEEYIKACIARGGSAGSAGAGDKASNEQLMKFVVWAQDNKVIFHESEKKLYSPTHKFAGTCDFVCSIEGKKYVGDIKTSNGFYGMEGVLQCAGYRIMLEELGENDYIGSVLIRLGKDGSFEELYREDPMGEDRTTFLSLLRVYKETNKFKKWLDNNRHI